MLDISERVGKALQAERWPLELEIVAEGPAATQRWRYAVPVRVYVAADGSGCRSEADGEPFEIGFVVTVDRAGSMIVENAARGTIDSDAAVHDTNVPPQRIPIAGGRLILRVEARPRNPGERPSKTTSLGPNHSATFPARTVATLGCLTTSDLCIADSSVAPDHLLLIRDGDRVLVVDGVNSSGTWINDRPVVASELRQDDWLQVGRVRLLFDGRTTLHQPGGIRGARVKLWDLRLTYRRAEPLTRRLRRMLAQHTRGRARRRSSPSLVEIRMAGDEITIPAGSFVGIIGPSGIGKTTLLRALAGLKAAAGGRVELDGRPLHPGPQPPSLLGYVPQDDIVHTALTVREVLDYAVRLRTGLSGEQIEQRIENVVTLVELNKWINQRVSRLSGGQRKRVSIAVELVAEPGVLLLDEPSSGLDPATERKLMRRLRVLSRRGQTVILTTHVFESVDLLDRVFVLARPRAEGCAVVRMFLSIADVLRCFDVQNVGQLFESLESGLPPGAINVAQDVA